MRHNTWRIGALGAALALTGLACSDDETDEDIDQIEEEIDTAVDNVEEELDTIVDEAEEELEDTDLDPGEGTGLPGDDDDEGTDTTTGG
ncbi:MAG TPA: hypothetical protein VG478_05420 [Acidimicrobiales bacterium]|jgi:hypothetical protein|nr:hypothetical protein [Acidimicrobiales bacterium]